MRTTEAFGTFAPALTAAIAEVDATTPVAELKPLSRTLSEQLQELRLAALIVGAFALVAAMLAATGVYGVISLAVADRAREIALRIVVGAEARQIATMMLRNTLRMVAVGFVLGLVVAAIGSRLLAGRSTESRRRIHRRTRWWRCCSSSLRWRLVYCRHSRQRESTRPLHSKRSDAVR